MGRVPSLYYDDGPGKDFHAKDKPLLLGVVTGLWDFNTFKSLVIRPEWLTIDKTDAVTDSMRLAMLLRDEYIREVPKLLRGVSWLNRLAIHRLADFLVTLHRNDDMYYERFGYLMWRFIQRGDDWASTNKDGRIQILVEERSSYLENEHRADRIQWITAGWDYFLKMYATDDGIMRSVDFIVGRLNVHKDKFNRDEVSRLGITAFYPEHWYPVGRGMLWDMAHGGKG